MAPPYLNNKGENSFHISESLNINFLKSNMVPYTFRHIMYMCVCVCVCKSGAAAALSKQELVYFTF
jgi:hypothetical protein